MRCPYQTVKTTEIVRAMAVGNEDMQITREFFAECLKGECPLYTEHKSSVDGKITEYCERAENERMGRK